MVPASFRAARKDTLGEGCRSGTWDYFLGRQKAMWKERARKKKAFGCRNTRQLAGALGVSGNYKCGTKDGRTYGGLQRQMRRPLRNGEFS